ncbi:MAG TPA: hypothetical protein VNA25_11145 [Phycisphaerae bacterium]|nr:hypothetical protein [Phycisphaerae bacterium]
MAKKEIVPVSPGALMVPDYVKNAAGPAGRENIRREDLTLPRLALAQALSPQVNPDDDAYIDGLRNGDLFNSLTGEAYGRGPVEVLVIRVEPVRYMEFDPNERANILDRDVPEGDPRTMWGADGAKPKATKFMDFLALHAETAEPIGLSFKDTSLKAGKDVNTFLEMYPKRAIRIGTAQKKNEHGSFYVYTATLGNYAAECAYQAQETLLAGWASGTVTVDKGSVGEAKDDMADDATSKPSWTPF